MVRSGFLPSLVGVFVVVCLAGCAGAPVATQSPTAEQRSPPLATQTAKKPSGYHRGSLPTVGVVLDVPDGWYLVDWPSTGVLPGKLLTPGGVEPAIDAGTTDGLNVAWVTIGDATQPLAKAADDLLTEMVGTLPGATRIDLPAGPAVQWEETSPDGEGVSLAILVEVYLDEDDCSRKIGVLLVSRSAKHLDSEARAMAEAVARSIEVMWTKDACGSPAGGATLPPEETATRSAAAEVAVGTRTDPGSIWSGTATCEWTHAATSIGEIVGLDVPLTDPHLLANVRDVVGGPLAVEMRIQIVRLGGRIVHEDTYADGSHMGGELAAEIVDVAPDGRAGTAVLREAEPDVLITWKCLGGP